LRLFRAALVLGFLWVVGFGFFVRAALQYYAPPPVADGIAVLTGGADRIGAGVALLRARRGRLLLISGVGGAALPATVLREAGVDYAPLADQISLGRDATSTAGNAAEIAAWAAGAGLHSVIVVTAIYHMPRAMLEIHRAAPGLILYPMPVRPPALRGPQGWSSLKILASEYGKFLGAEIGLTGFEERP